MNDTERASRPSLDALEPHWKRLLRHCTEFNATQRGPLRRGAGIGAPERAAPGRTRIGVGAGMASP